MATYLIHSSYDAILTLSQREIATWTLPCIAHLTLLAERNPLTLSPQSAHRVAVVTFCRTFHIDGKIGPASWRVKGEGWRVHALLLSLYLPSPTKLWCTLQLRGQIPSPFSPLPYMYVYSVPVDVLYNSTVNVGGGGGGGGAWDSWVFKTILLLRIVQDSDKEDLTPGRQVAQRRRPLTLTHIFTAQSFASNFLRPIDFRLAFYILHTFFDGSTYVLSIKFA